jgi:hypothetical protein
MKHDLSPLLDLQYEAAVDEHFRLMLEANAAEPYSHYEYTRQARLAYAALFLYTKGDAELAGALADAFHDSNEKMEWYRTGLGWSAEMLKDQADHYVQINLY